MNDTFKKGMAAAALIIAAIIGVYLWNTPRYEIIAGPITTAGRIDGTFRVIERRRIDLKLPDTGQPFAIFPGILSDRIGGACIAFRARDLGYQRMMAVQCESTPQCTGMEAGDGAYCDVSTKECWAKPTGPTGEALCRRSKDIDPQTNAKYGAWAPGVDHNITRAPVNVPNLQPNAQARVIACLNESGSLDCANPGGTRRIEVMGQPAPVN